MKRSFAGSWDCTRNLCRSVSQFVNLAGLREDETWTGPWESMHVGSFSPGRAGQKLGNSESQVCL